MSNNKVKSQLEIIRNVIKKDAFLNAKSLISEEEMNSNDYEIENSKALLIMEDAIVKILRECNLYGDEAILQKDNQSLLSCKNYILAIAQVCSENIDAEINILKNENTQYLKVKPYKFKNLKSNN